LKALAARYQWLQGTSDSMRVQGSTDPLRAHLLLNILVPGITARRAAPPGVVIYTCEASSVRTFAKWHAVQLLVCGVDAMDVLHI
jgi:hypothetical protein